MIVIQFFFGLILSFLPRNILALFFHNLNGLKPNFYFSGRVALNKLALSLHSKNIKLVMLPDYVCNVVYEAFSRAGFEIETFSINQEFEPSTFMLEKMIKKKKKPSALCLAPIYGAEGGIDWITSDIGRKLRSQYNVTLVLDLCQDFSRAQNIMMKDEINYAVISSFNDKSFPGLMGSVSWSDIRDKNYKKANLNEKIMLFRLFIVKLVYLSLIRLKIFRSAKKSKFKSLNAYDFSYCKTFSYNFNHSAASNLQIGIGLVGIFFQKIYFKRKLLDLKKVSHNIIKTPFYLTSPYQIFDKSFNINRKVKLPYATPLNPKKSFYPNLKIFHFKGFNDVNIIKK